MSGVNADPQNLRSFQRQLKQFRNELNSITSKLNGHLRVLNEGWRDPEYYKFEKQVQEMISAMKRFSDQSDQYVSYLDKKAKKLEEFLGR